jgi:iron complex transport system ATP-binding protein
LAVEAPVLLADEPIAALDPEHQIGMAQLMRQLAHEGRAVLAVVHDLTLASRFGDRVVVLNSGRLVADGEPLRTLTPDLLQQVFGIKAEILTSGSAKALVPWSISSDAPHRFS